MVILAPHTVVDPSAVVVELVNAAIARTAVLRPFQDVRVTYLTHELVFFPWEALVLDFANSLEPDRWVRRVSSSGFGPEVSG